MKVLDTRDDYLDYVKTLLPQNPKVLEIGVEYGHFSEKILKVLQPSELHLLDPWEWNPGNGLVYQEGHMTGTPTAHSNVTMQINIERKYEAQISAGQIYVHRGYSHELVDTFDTAYFDFIYLDPPYYVNFHELVLNQIFNCNFLKKDSIVICEHSPNLFIKKSTLWETIDVRNYGQSRLTFLINVQHP
mgnify:CR=1 FL=1